MRKLIVYQVWCHCIKPERRATKNQRLGWCHSWNVRAIYIPICVLTCADLVFSIIQAFATLTAGIIIGMIFVWKLGLIGIGTFPLHLSSSSMLTA